MFSARVAQKPTMPVRDGKNTCQNWPSLGIPGPNWLGAEKASPKPPAIDQAHAEHDAPIGTAREIALFPPMTGG